MTDDYPSFGDSSLFGANVYYPFGPVRGGSAAIPTAGEFLNGRASACRLTKNVPASLLLLSRKTRAGLGDSLAIPLQPEAA